MNLLKDLFLYLFVMLILALLLAAVVYPFLWLSGSLIYRPIIIVSYPFLTILAWSGYPLAYYKLTGQRFIRELPDNVHSNVYGGIEGQLYRYRYRANVDGNASLEERGFTPFISQNHEWYIFGKEPTGPEKKMLRRQRAFRVLFLLAILFASEAWLNALGTSWQTFFD